MPESSYLGRAHAASHKKPTLSGMQTPPLGAPLFASFLNKVERLDAISIATLRDYGIRYVIAWKNLKLIPFSDKRLLSFEHFPHDDSVRVIADTGDALIFEVMNAKEWSSKYFSDRLIAPKSGTIYPENLSLALDKVVGNPNDEATTFRFPSDEKYELLFYGPYISLEKGSYDVDYDLHCPEKGTCDGNIEMNIYGSSSGKVFLAKQVRLSRSESNQDFKGQFTLEKSDVMEFRMTAKGNGRLAFRKIEFKAKAAVNQ